MRRLAALLLLPLLAAAAGCTGLAAKGSTAHRTATPADTRPYIVVAVPGQAPARRPPVFAIHGIYTPSSDYAVDPAAQRALKALAREYHLTQVDAWPIRALGLECAVFDIGAQASRPELLAQLAHDQRVSIAEPLQEFATRGAGSGDPYAAVQANLRELDVEGAHRWSVGRGVRIAIIDTGMDTTHPDLAGRIDATRNFVDHDARQFDRDRHGTAVAGVIAADAGNGVGISGIAPEARLVALKACWQLEPGRDAARCNSFTLAQALAAALELRVRIINLSLAGPPDALLEALTRRAIESGIIVVGADAPEAPGGFPAGLSGVLAVASAGQRATPEGVLRAPGQEVLTLAPGGRYDFASGDSIATAEISGIAALLLARQPALDVAAIHSLLQGSVETPAGVATGGHSANACRALTLLLKTGSCTTAVAASGQSAPRVTRND